MTTYRTGRDDGRTVYRVGPDGTDELIGVMDTPELGHLVVDALNATRPIADLLPEDRATCPFCMTGLAQHCPRHRGGAT